MGAPLALFALGPRADARPYGPDEAGFLKSVAACAAAPIENGLIHDELRQVVFAKDQQENGGDLRDHLEFSQWRRGNRDAPRLRQAAEHGDGNLPPENHDHDPRLSQVHLDQRDERRGDQELVRQRVHELPERRDLLPAAREVAIEPVGQRRQAEDRRPHQFFANAKNQAPLELRQQNHHEQRHEEDASDGDRVGKIHRIADC